MTEIKAEPVSHVDRYAVLGDFVIENDELESLYTYLKENEREREQELIEVARKAKRMEDGQARLYSYYKRIQEKLKKRNRDLGRLTAMMEKM